MILLKRKRRKFPKIKINKFVKLIVIFILPSVLLTGVVIFSLYKGMELHRDGVSMKIKTQISVFAEERFSFLANIFKSIGVNIEKISIDIKHEDYQKLAYKREQALELGNLFTDSNDFVPAKLTYNGKEVNVKIRLKGDFIDHWSDNKKWSFRVEVKNGETINGMSVFSLQHPKTRSYLNEWYFHKFLNFNGLIYMRYKFLDFSINGDNLGTYVMEEHFDKRLIENNEYREGPIFRFDDNDLPWLSDPPYPQVDEFNLSVLKSFNTNKLMENDQKYSQFISAKNLMNSLRKGELKTSQVFDDVKLAKIFAIADLAGHEHGTFFNNLRFYYNPVTSLVEPIMYDNQNIVDIENIESERAEKNLNFIEIIERGFTFKEILFNDLEFFKEYIKALDEISKKEMLDEFFKSTDDEYNKNLLILYKSYPWYAFQGRPILYRNQEYIQNILNPVQAFQAYFVNHEDGKVKMQIGNSQSLPIEILGIEYNGNKYITSSETVLLSKPKSKLPYFEDVYFEVPDNTEINLVDAKNILVEYRVLGLDSVRMEGVYPWELIDDNYLDNDFIRKSDNWRDFYFIETDEESKTIVIPRGKYNLDKNLKIGKGYKVIIDNGTQINLNNSAKILSYSPVYFRGTEDSPIIVESTDGTGQGIVVLNADEESKISFTKFSNLTAPSEGNWSLTGAVNFYESDVVIVNSLFEDNHGCDDNLNIIRSNFLIDNSSFVGTYADAIDFDFSAGKITNSFFKNVGVKDGNGDGIDLSGSNVEIVNSKFINIGDKGISAGERSNVSVSDSYIESANIAIASKDLSELNISNSELKDNNISYSVYQKKPEFGSAMIISSDVAESGNQTQYLVEDGSSLYLDGEKINENSINVIKDLGQ